MSKQNMTRLARYDYLLLLPILGLAFYVAFIPNMNYPYPVHIDEWLRMATINTILNTNIINYPDPTSGQAISGFAIWGSRLEIGFNTLFGMFYKISGLSWLTIFRYFPSIIFMMTVFSVYTLARRQGFGWEAAFFTLLIPTTVGILGPAFLVPVALGLLFVPLSLLLIFYYRTIWSYLILFVFSIFLIISHATSAVCLVLIVIPAILLYLKSEPKHGLKLLLVWGIPFLVTLPWTYDLIISTARGLFEQKPLPPFHDLPHIIRIYGYIPIGLGLLGTFTFAWKGGGRNYALAMGLLIMVLMLATFYTLHYGVGLLYLRGILYTLLMLGIAAGAGLMVIKNIKLPERFKLPAPIRRMGYLLCLVLVIIILWISIPYRQNIPYYYMIDTTDYETFVWIRDNVDESYEKAILDPWKATAFTAITGKYVYTRLHMSPNEITREVSRFIEAGCTDTDFLRGKGISIVYTRGECDNPDLVKVRDFVYLLEE